MGQIDIEKRIYGAMEIRAAASETGKRSVSGYGAVFNKRSEILYDYWVGSFREVIHPDAFKDADMSDVRALRDHNPTQILGRTKSGTLELVTDETGLHYRFDLPETTYANDLWESMQRGDVDQSSFAFTVAQDTWGEDSDGIPVRTITKIARVFDISPVTYPAYPDANSGADRSEVVLSKRCMNYLQGIAPKQDTKAQAHARARALYFHNSNK